MKKILYGLMAMLALSSCAKSDVKGGKTEADVVEKVMMDRRSVRQFTEQPISRDTLHRILRCGINAPNGQNRQAYEIRVVDDPKLISEISDAVLKDNPGMKPQHGAKNIFLGAPCVIFLANDTTYDMSQVDCGLLGENVVLSAWTMGVGSCCMAHPVRLMKSSEACATYIKRLGFSEGYNLLIALAMGYPDEHPEAKPRKEEMVRFVE